MSLGRVVLGGSPQYEVLLGMRFFKKGGLGGGAVFLRLNVIWIIVPLGVRSARRRRPKMEFFKTNVLRSCFNEDEDPEVMISQKFQGWDVPRMGYSSVWIVQRWFKARYKAGIKGGLNYCFNC